VVERFPAAAPLTLVPVAVAGVRRVYPSADGAVVALDGVSLDAPPGRLTVVAGRSGCGKSTLLRIVAAIDRPDDGSVIVDGVDVGQASRRVRRAQRRTRIGFVFATPAHNLLPGLDALGNLGLVQRLRGDRSDPREWMARVGLSGHEHSRVAELSGGEQQRLAFAMAAVGKPAVVVADEPTAELDTTTTAEVVQVLRDLADDGVTFLVASHDQQVIAKGDVVVRLEDGRRIA
jgi:ABC-type lipoprotein export system ATPase subunit